MKKPKRKQTVDLLALPQKERVRLCKEIRALLHQKVLEEKVLQRKTETETQQQYESSESKLLMKTSKSHLREYPIASHPIQLY
jgi:hypothetical protein